jgi:hypothetical protein
MLRMFCVIPQSLYHELTIRACSHETLAQTLWPCLEHIMTDRDRIHQIAQLGLIYDRVLHICITIINGTV